MPAQRYNFSVGSYNEAPEGTIANSGVALLASTLAWAAKNNIPFHDAIISLTETGSVTRFNATGLNRELFTIFPESRNWNQSLILAGGDLMAGMPLYAALRKRLRYFLPEYFLQAVQAAEMEGRLPEVLPHFAKRLNFSARIRTSYKMAISGPAIEFMLLATLILFLVVFIVPNFKRIFDELLAGAPLPDIATFGIGLSNVFRGQILHLILGIPIILILYRIFRPQIQYILGEIFIYVPYFRGQLKDFAVLELAASMSSYLASGSDVLCSAKLSCKACRHFWLKRKLRRFINKLETGADWLEAWREMKLDLPLDEVILRNADSRENLIDGFDTIADWHYHRALSNTRKNSIWLYMIFFGFNAALVFLITSAVFASLTMIIEKVI